MSWLALCVCPVLFLGGVWWLCLTRKPTGRRSTGVGVPRRPEGDPKLFEFGLLVGEYRAVEEKDRVLARMGKLVGPEEPPFQAWEVDAFEEAMRGGTGSRIWGTMTFIDVVVVFLLVGAGVSLTGAFYAMFQPASWLLEPVIYAVCLGGVSRSLASSQQHVASLSVLVAALLGLSYTVSIHSSEGAPADLFTLASIFGCATAAPLAAVFDSSVLGFASVSFFFGALGFSVVTELLVWILGFGSDEIIVRCAASSLAILVIVIVLKAGNVDGGPFSAGLSVMGSLVYFLSLLVISSEHYTSEISFADRNIFVVASLACVACAGYVLQLGAMAKTTVVFAAIYMVVRITELDAIGGWPAAFVAFFGLYLGATHLSRHPEIVATFFDASR